MWRFTIFQRLILGYLTILLVLLCLGGYSVWRLSQLNQIVRYLSAVDSEIIRAANNSKDTLITQVSYEQKFIVSLDADFYQQFWLARDFMVKKVHLMDAIMADHADRDPLVHFKEAYNRYLDEAAKEFGWIQNNTPYGRQEIEDRKRELINSLISILDNIIRTARSDMYEKIRLANTIGEQGVRFTAIATATAIVMALFIAFLNARGINRPIVKLMKGTTRIAQGDFSQPLDIFSPPEINALAESFNRMCERLQELDEMKADFISHISHELRTPLTSIREASSLLLAARGKPDGSTQQGLVIIIQQECERLIRLVNRILDLSRLESGMMDFQMERIDLSALFKKSIARLHPIARKKGLALHLKLPPNLPMVCGDWEKLDQVIGNLLGNAFKFTPPGGRITITAARKNKPKAGKTRQDIIEVCIADTGCGIAKENLSNIFDKFRKVRGQGSGLGLAIVKHITGAHGGEVWAESHLNAGSAFFFTLPVAS